MAVRLCLFGLTVARVGCTDEIGETRIISYGFRSGVDE